jgi:2-oxoisovalerate ferredoxin oxidoreductase beta subunit
MKFSGYGGQGVLSLGLWLAEAARIDKRFTTWFPSYGPEQRGGAASCAVVASGRMVGSPAADSPNLLVAMNQVAYERFVGDVPPGGVVFVDETVLLHSAPVEGARVIPVPAIRLASEFGLAQAANTIMLAAISVSEVIDINRASLLKSLEAGFRKKPELAELNRALFVKAESWLKEHLGSSSASVSDQDSDEPFEYECAIRCHPTCV